MSKTFACWFFAANELLLLNASKIPYDVISGTWSGTVRIIH